ncbi:MAG TPA: dihydropteroate synthase [Candidatus Eisenbacteria bacterium]|nr:dihydropteroate synthase [Candidatus Eisenbacteria bacterium]
MLATPYPAGPLHFRHRLGSWDLAEGPRVVGILNVTPDSFSDGGKYLSPEDALAKAFAMAEEGADAIDVGGQSTRPRGPASLGAGAEWDRIAPVIQLLAARLPEMPVSVDTYWGEVARRALGEGAAMVNDVSGLGVDPAIADAVAASEAGLVLMHSVGAPDRFHDRREYADVTAEVRDFLSARLEQAVAAGVPRDRIALDPGVGFSKRAEQSVEALRGLPLLTALGRPLYIGVSRKSFLGALTGESVDRRMAAGLGATVAAFALGGRIFRTHDVRETRDTLRAARAILDDTVDPASLMAPEEVSRESRARAPMADQPVPERRS